MKIKPFTVFFILVILGAIAYGNSLHGKFVWDDEMLVRDNPFIRHWSFLGKIFTQNIVGGIGEESYFYRPLQMASYTLDHSLWRLNVVGYHVTNIFLHVLVSWFFYRLLVSLFADEALAFVAAVFFIVHPLHVEAVSYISGRSDIMSALFLILTLLFYLKQARSPKTSFTLLMLASYSAALLSREQALVLPFLVLAYHGIFRKKIVIKDFIPLVGLALIYLFWRAVVLRGTTQDPVLTSALERTPGFFAAFATYLKLFLFPAPLHMEYGERLFSFGDPWVWAGILLMGAALVLMRVVRDRRKIALFSLSWFLLTLLPVSNIYPVGAFMAEHWMYMPSMGLFLLSAWGIQGLYRNRDTRVLSFILSAGFAIFFLFLTIRQNVTWREPVAFYERTLTFAPDSPRVLNNLGNIRQEEGRAEEAIAFYEKALSIKPVYAQALNNLGSAYASIKDFEKATACFLKALGYKPRYADAYYNFGNTYEKMGRIPDAIESYQRAIQLRPDNADYYYNIGNAYKSSGRFQEAISSYRKALEISPDLNDAANNLGLAYIAAGRRDEARSLFEDLVRARPDYPKAYTNLAVFYYQENEIDRARQYAREAVRLGDRVDQGFLNILFGQDPSQG